MPRRRTRKTRTRTILLLLAVFPAIILISAFGEIIAHLFTYVFLGLIPVAYMAGVRIERRRITGTHRKLQANASYGKTVRMDAVSAYPPEFSGQSTTPMPRLSRSGLLHDPRSGARPFGKRALVAAL